MKKPILAVVATSFCKNKDLVQLATERLSSCFELKFNSSNVELAGKDLQDFLSGAESAIVGKEKIDQTLISKLPQLKQISKYGVGLDNLDFKALSAAHIQVHHESGVNRQAVAELTISFMISLFRNIVKTDRLLRCGEWHKNGGAQFSGKKVGIIGCGNIGSLVGRLAHQFGCEVLVQDILPRENPDIWTQVELEQILRNCDVISLHIPLDVHTRHFMGASELNLMKNQAFLVNTARGGLVCEKALVSALESGEIAGAALDVYEIEPCLNSRLLSLDNVISTPHIAGNAREAVLSMGMAAIRGMCPG